MLACRPARRLVDDRGRLVERVPAMNPPPMSTTRMGGMPRVTEASKIEHTLGRMSCALSPA
jgi:hypothetical protein